MAVEWSLLGPPPDLPGAVRHGFEYGRAMRQRAKQESAFSALAADPTNRSALADLASTGPEGMRTAWAFEDRAREQEGAALAELERHRENIIKGARIVREINPRDDASWQQVLTMAAQLGIPLDGVPTKYDPTYANNLVKVADTFAPSSAAERKLVQTDGVFFDQRTGEPVFESPYPKIVSGPGGIYAQPRIGIGRGGQGAAPQGRVIEGELPPGWTVIEEDEGGPSPRGSGTFP